MDWKVFGIKAQRKIQHVVHRWQEWNDDHATVRRLTITGILVVGMAGLFISTKILPGPSQYTTSPLHQAENLGSNGSTTVTLTSRAYNPVKNFMVITFKVSADASQALDPNNIAIRVKTLSSAKVTYQLVPLLNGRYVVILDNLPHDYRAVQLKVINKQGSVEDLTSSSSSVAKDPVSGTSKNAYAFIINQDKKLNDRKLKRLSQKEYLIEDLQDAIKQQQQRQVKLKSNIKAYQKQLAADQAALAQIDANKQYSVNKNSASSKTLEAQTDIESQQASIKSAKRSLKRSKQQVWLYRKQIQDIRTGKYKLHGKVKTGKLE